MLIKNPFLQTFLTILFLNQITSIKCFIDLFLNSNETSSLLGFSNVFFYVFNGELRQNSISYRIDIPDYKNLIEFNWRINGPSYLMIDYEFNLNDTKHSNLSINSTGRLPSKLSQFYINLNCRNNNKSKLDENTNTNYYDIKFDLFFKLDSSISSISASNSLQLKLNTMPSLNFSINYRKHCTPHGPTSNKTTSSQLNSKKANNNFTIAYITIGTLVGFSLIIFLAAFIMYIKNKLKIKKLNSQYESLKANKMNHNAINTTNNSIPIIPSSHSHREYRNKRHDYFKNNEQSNSDNQLIQSDTSNTKIIKTNRSYSKNGNVRKPRQLKQQQQQQNQGNDDNLYESVHDASVNVYITQSEIMSDETSANNNTKKYSRITLKEKQYLNMTTNTIQSVCNTTVNTNASYVADTTSSNSNLNSKRNNVELCVRFKRDLIELKSVYLEGTFSKIYNGILKREDNQNEIIKVLIKMPNDHASKEQIDLMLKESCFMRGLKHKNITSIMGVCIDDYEDEEDLTNSSHSKPMALFNYCEIGNLKVYLTQMRLNNKNKHNFILPNTAQINSIEQDVISVQELLYIVMQLLKGLNYLHSKHIIHRDIAARNCWLDTNYSLKLGDYALSRDLFPDDYNCLANNENKPISWMSIESLKSNTYNTKTDVWSVGVTIWECFTLAGQPYSQVDPFELCDYLEDSDTNRLEKPLNCSEDLYDVYSKCWLIESSMRPTLKELFHSIHKIYTNLNSYV